MRGSITLSELGSKTSGTLSYLDAGGEQTVVEITNSTRKVIQGIWLDMTNLTQNGEVILYYKVDGTNYREFDFVLWNAASDSPGLYFPGPMAIGEDLKVTYEEDADEGAARNIPYAIIYTKLE